MYKDIEKTYETIDVTYEEVPKWDNVLDFHFTTNFQKIYFMPDRPTCTATANEVSGILTARSSDLNTWSQTSVLPGILILNSNLKAELKLNVYQDWTSSPPRYDS